jgi:formylmethanofuran dehydrogenase subunit B
MTDLAYPTVEAVIPPTVRFTSAISGVHRPGTAYRMDEIPIPLRCVWRPTTQATATC